MSETKFTPGPWFVRDFRASELRRLGWVGPSVDRILIINKNGLEIEASGGADCVIARIQFDNRPDELGDGNIADAHLIASAPTMFQELLDTDDALTKLIRDLEGFVKAKDVAIVVKWRDRVRATISKARGEARKEDER